MTQSIIRRITIGLALIIALAIWAPSPAEALDGGGLDGASAGSFFGAVAGIQLGRSVAMAGDVNGDGLADILIGVPFSSSGRGSVFLVPGGPAALGLDTNLGQRPPVVQYVGEASGDNAGISVAGAGDVNGDGFDDILIGARLNSNFAGAAYLVLGSATPASGSLSTAIKFSGVVAGSLAGTSVAGAGDVNGDGFVDLLVGASEISNSTGAAYLVLGSAAPASANLSTAVKYSGETTNSLTGESVAGAGDVNGDGFDDIVIGAPRNSGVSGAAYLVLGSLAPASGSLSTASKYLGEASGDLAGISVAGAGDINGDGFSDILVGAPNNAPGGAAYLVLGGTSPAGSSLTAAVKFSAETANDNAGNAVSPAGDVNGDGYADMLVGAPTDNAGAAYMVAGSARPASTSLSTAVKFSGAIAGDNAGFSLAGAGDVNGDGRADILVGAFSMNNNTGGAFLVTGDAQSAANPSFRQRQRQLGSGNLPPVLLNQIGVQVDFTAAAVSGGDISVTRHAFHPCATSQRLPMPIWTVATNKLAAQGGPTLVNLRFKYNNDQIAGLVEANLKLWTRPAEQPCADWVQVAGATVDTAHNFVSAAGLTSLGQFTIAETAPSPTAITDLSFIARAAQEPMSWSLLAALGLSGGTLLYLRRRPARPLDEL